MKQGFEKEELLQIKGKGKDKIHPKTRHEEPELKYSCSSTLSLNSALSGGWSTLGSGRFTPGKKTWYPCTGGLVFLRAGLDRR